MIKKVIGLVGRAGKDKKVIGLVGRAGAGKDTVAGYWVDELIKRGKKVKCFAFADKLKEIISEAYDVPLVNFYNRELKNLPDSRFSNQGFKSSAYFDTYFYKFKSVLKDLYGDNFECTEEYAKDQCEHIFMNLPENCSPRRACQLIGTEGFCAINESTWTNYVMRKVNEFDGISIITDVRFSNEFNRIAGTDGGLIVGIDNPKSEKYYHASEVEVDGLVNLSTYCIINNGTLHELKQKAMNILSLII